MFGPYSGVTLKKQAWGHSYSCQEVSRIETHTRTREGKMPNPQCKL